MKKLLFFVLLFQVNFFAYSQMTKSEVAEYIFNQLYYGSVNTYEASEFPNPFIDLTDGNELTKKIKVLSYLEYDDSETPFPRYGHFEGWSIMSRLFALKSMMEAWNIPVAYSSTSPFSDMDVGDIYFEYALGAYNAGIIAGGNFNPTSAITTSSIDDIYTNLSDAGYSDISESTLQNMNNYFIPNNYTPYNIGFNRGLEQGVFSHYAKNSFVIPDIKLNLNFSHSYSTQMVELDESFFPIKPLARGWTHTYNSYAVKENINGEIIYTIVWSDGTINIWNEDTQEYITNGVYDDFDESSSSRIYITKKNQTRFKFQRLDSDRDIYYLREIKDRNDNEINIYYENAEEDDTKRISYVQSPSGKQLNFEYHDDTDFIDIITDPIGRTIEFEFTGLTPGWVYNYPVLVNFKDARGHYTNYAYDISNPSNLHPLNRIELPEDNLITAEYNDVQLIEYTVNGNSVDIIINTDDYDAITSDVSVPMPNGSTQNFHYQYNENGILTQFVNDTDNMSFNYDAPQNININRPSNINKNGLDIDYEYDDKGNVTKTTTEGILNEYFFYNDNNDLGLYENANGRTTRFYYEDADENLTKIRDALGKFSYLTYFPNGLLKTSTNQEGITITYTYEDGVVKTISAPENMSASFNYDGVNRVMSKIINGQTSSYLYDENDNLKSHTNIGGFTTTFMYDDNDNIETITNAQLNVTAFTYTNKDQIETETFGSLVKEYDYNDNGTLNWYKKPSGDVVNFDYDDEGRIDETGTITNINYYDSGNEKGLLKTIYNSDGYYKYYYDDYNRVKKVKDYFNNTDITQYEYDNVGNITKIIYPNNSVDFYVRYVYDFKNRMTDIKTGINGNEQTVIHYTYRNDDKLNEVRYSIEPSTRKIKKYYFYDDIGRLEKIQYDKFPVGGGASILYKEELVINNRGNIESDDKYYGVAEIDYTLNQETETYNYDPNNQITQAGTTNYNVNDDGNTIQKGSLNLNYDIDDRLTSITGNNGTTNVNIQHKYDVYGNRVEKNIIAGTTNPETRKYVWDVMNNNIIKEYNPNGSEQFFYVHGATGLEFRVYPNNGAIDVFYHGDVRGSIVFTTNTDAEIQTGFNKYDDFGNIITQNFADAEIYGAFYYLGKHGIINDVTAYDGLYQVKARYYDAKLGRFLTQDPIWSTNLYPYANNNPISNIDRDGQFLESVTNEFYNLTGTLIANNLTLKQIENLHSNVGYIAEGRYLGTGTVQDAFDYYENMYIQNYVLGESTLSAQVGMAMTSLWLPDTHQSTIGALTLKSAVNKAPQKLTKLIGKTGTFKFLDMRRKLGLSLKSYYQYLLLYGKTNNSLKR